MTPMKMERRRKTRSSRAGRDARDQFFGGYAGCAAVFSVYAGDGLYFFVDHCSVPFGDLASSRRRASSPVGAPHIWLVWISVS